jgi:hypothetical protein
MPTATLTHHVFVDFENVPDIDLGLIAGQPAKVTLLIGKQQKKLGLPLVQQIHRLAGQVVLVEVGAAGRNALDMTLACYLGQAVHQSPRDHFHIVSGDKDYDQLISHLRARGQAVQRHGSFTALPFLPRSRKTAGAAKPAPAVAKTRPLTGAKAPVDRRAKVIARLQNPASRNRPASKRALLMHIKASLGKEASDAKADDIMKELCETQVLSIDAKDKIRYGAAG